MGLKGWLARRSRKKSPAKARRVLPDWPPLPQTGFLAGRPATEQDIEDGNAIFVAKAENFRTGKPIATPIPQYALLKDNAGKTVPVFVVQAEQSLDDRLYGLRDFSGKEFVATEAHLRLLGTKPFR